MLQRDAADAATIDPAALHAARESSVARALGRVGAVARLRRRGAALLVASIALLVAIVPLPERGARAQSTDAARVVAPAGASAGLTMRVVGTGHTAPVRRIAISPDQKTLVSVGDDRSVRLWRIDERRLLQTLWPTAASTEGGRLYGTAYSPAGDEFAVGGDPQRDRDATNRLYVYRSENGALARTLETPPGKVRRILWARTATHLATCSIEPNRFVIVSRAGGVQFDRTLDGPCYGLAELADGTLLAGESGGTIRRFALRDGRWTELSRWKTTGTIITSFAVSPDGRHLVVGFLDDSDNPDSTRVPLVEVLDTATGQSAKAWRFPGIRIGNLRTVGWSADGARIIATGSPQRDRGRFVALHIGWPSGDAAESVISNDTIFDALAYGGDGFVLAHADSTWSIVRPDARTGAPTMVRPLERQAADLRGAGNLRVSPDAKTVGFTLRDGEAAAEFSLADRRLRAGRSAHPSPTHSSWQLPVNRWENRRGPSVAGRTIDLGEIDVSRAAAISEDRSAVYLGTNHTLRRLRADGSPEWAISPGVETRAVHVSADGRIVVSAMLDGTVRWWRASDGRPLLTLYLQLDGRWILWTEGGYYDAAPGADALIGFVRDRRDAAGADFFSLGRFRDARHRPDVIDRVLDTLDPAAALSQADLERRRLAERLEDQSVRQQVLASVIATPVEVRTVPDRVAQSRPVPDPVAVRPVPDRVAQSRPVPDPVAAQPVPAPVGVNAQASMPVPPPVVTLAAGRLVRTQGRELGLDFFVRALGEQATGVEVRVDGRPAEIVRSHLPSMQDGSAVGRVVLRLPEQAGRITVMALAGKQASEPVQVDIEWAQPVAATATPGTATAALPGARPSLATAAPRTPVVLSPPPRRLFVLSIGVSKYRRTAYSTLRFAAKDADDFAAALDAQKGRIYESVQTRVLTDARATRAAILEGLEWLQRAVEPTDTAIVFLAGHGINDPSGRYHFLGHDADVAQPSSTAVGESEFRGALTRLRGRVLLFADTCHAGGVVGTGAAATSEFARMASTLSSPETGVVVFASSTRQQESLERDQDRNGLFTKVLLEGLAGRADLLGQGQVTHQGLGYFLAQTVRQRTDGAQTPVYVSPLGNTDYALVALR